MKNSTPSTDADSSRLSATDDSSRLSAAHDSSRLPTAQDSSRLDALDAPWRARPIIMSLLCAMAGFIFFHLVDGGDYPASATFVAVATVVFVLTAEFRRIGWAAGFAIGWGAVLALIMYNNQGYSVNSSPFEWPFWSGLLAVLVAAPIFQTRRDVAPDWRFWRLWDMPYDRLHQHAWTDAVIGAAALVFVGISVLLAWLIAGLFNLIGIKFLVDLLGEGSFVLPLCGTAFGAAVGLLRERDRLVGTLQRLVMIVLAVLAPILAAALVLFLLSLLGTGFTKLWDSGFSTAALMLAAAAFAVLLANAVIGNGVDDRATNPLLRWAAPVLAVAVLPLSLIALYAMSLRIGQYGWTPERIWGAIAAMVALAYGFAGVWALVRGRRDFDDALRPLQLKLAIGLMLLATFLALPIVDFGAISTRDQLARLESGAIKPIDFDWRAMAFDFGPNGRAALKQISNSADPAKANSAKAALAAPDRWDVDNDQIVEPLRPIESMVRVLPSGRPLPTAAYDALRQGGRCVRQACTVHWLDDDHFVLISRFRVDSDPEATFYARNAKAAIWDRHYPGIDAARETGTDKKVDLGKALVEVRTVSKRQVMVNGKPIGDLFD